MAKNIFTLFALASFSSFLFLSFYFIGLKHGREIGKYEPTLIMPMEASSKELKTTTPLPEAQKTPQTQAPQKTQQQVQTKYFNGPQLWEAVNKRRKEFGVSGLSQKDELCTIASIRLNELLDLGNLDGHEGFSTLTERRPDLSWIFEKYNISEFLLMGARDENEAVALWENTLGHKKLLTGGEYVWGCIYAQNSFAVAIAAY